MERYLFRLIHSNKKMYLEDLLPQRKIMEMPATSPLRSIFGMNGRLFYNNQEISVDDMRIYFRCYSAFINGYKLSHANTSDISLILSASEVFKHNYMTITFCELLALNTIEIILFRGGYINILNDLNDISRHQEALQYVLDNCTLL